jgi:hypothetical protein
LKKKGESLTDVSVAMSQQVEIKVLHTHSAAMSLPSKKKKRLQADALLIGKGPSQLKIYFL